MVSLSISISVSRRPSTEQPPPPPSLPQNPQPSIHRNAASISSRRPSYPNSITQPYSSSFDFSHPGPAPAYSAQRSESEDGSLERLLSAPRPKKRLSIVQFENGRLKRRIISMDRTQGVEIERKKSYGIGGAGNIRRPSDVIYPVRLNADGTRRRSSVWSSISAAPGTSPDGKRNGFLGFFRRGSAAQDAAVVSTVVDDDVGPTSRP
ncbi:uncharacterized protein LY89DRAFT_720258 [Mollisia scopiformis]|uniref:Uncharacterized protein n=1 Tax=Mollisia scopiformis TaxID=149040 RepID=A0A194X412_MOLSC|nr:uncharacterized protein LY89DRAFT_720258 [Mollisia scopiformis]KUJ14789.1 hypothetical protein LY89DRAFT_720258 [Mollisia scopiformis]